MYIYAFGSICRGEVDYLSDIDMLAIVNSKSNQFNPSDYSIYSCDRILELWKQGNPFAWHLYLESKLVYSSDSIDYLRDIGMPELYKNGISDCKKFREIFLSAKKSIEKSSFTEIFDLSCVFLSIRNFSTCYSLHLGIKPDFSRNSAFHLGIPIDKTIYGTLEKARALCTRGIGDVLTYNEISKAKKSLGEVDTWTKVILEAIKYEDYK